MKLDKKLNLVIPVETAESEIFVHSTLISRDIFEKYAFILSKTLSVLYEEGLTVFAGPRIAAMMLKKLAVEAAVWEGPDGVENGLMNEIRRLTNVVMPSEEGWKTTPYYEAVKGNLVDQEARDEIEGNIVFFTCVSVMHRRKEVPGLLAGMNEVWDTQNTSLNCTEWANSLPTSIEEESSGETVAQSLIPS